MNLAEATQATLVTTNVQIGNVGDYRVIVSYPAGTVTSGVAKLIVNPSKPEGGPSGFVRITPGTLVMESPESENGRLSDEAQHNVTLTEGFWMSNYETTQAGVSISGGEKSFVYKR